MNILFFSDNYPPEVNAAASRVHERACFWVRWGHQVTVITCAPNFPSGRVYDGYKNKWYQTEFIEGVRVVRVKTFIAPNAGFLLRIFDFLSYMVMAFFASLNEKKVDVILATSPQFFTAIAGWLSSVCKRKPFIFEISDLWPASIVAVGALKNHLLICMIESVELFLYRRADAIVSQTNAFKDDLVRRGIDANKISVVMNGVDTTRFVPMSKDAGLIKKLGIKGKFVIGYIGTLGMAHALDRVLRVAKQLSCSNIHFLFVGDGAAKKSLMKMKDKLHLTNVMFVDRQPKDEIAKYWSVCDLALIHLKNHPVFSTVVPSKIFEAMAMEIPIFLCAPNGEASNFVTENKIGVYVESYDDDSMLAEINEMFQNKCIYAALKNNCKFVAMRNNREIQASKMLKIVNRVVGQ